MAEKEKTVQLSSLHLANQTSRAWEDEARKQLARAEAAERRADELWNRLGDCQAERDNLRLGLRRG